MEIERLSSQPHSQQSHSEVDDDHSDISAVYSKFDQSKLNELAPKSSFILAGNTGSHKAMDKYEVNLFEKLFKSLKYKYEELIKLLKLYSEVTRI